MDEMKFLTALITKITVGPVLSDAHVAREKKVRVACSMWCSVYTPATPNRHAKEFCAFSDVEPSSTKLDVQTGSGSHTFLQSPKSCPGTMVHAWTAFLLVDLWVVERHICRTQTMALDWLFDRISSHP